VDIRTLSIDFDAFILERRHSRRDGSSGPGSRALCSWKTRQRHVRRGTRDATGGTSTSALRAPLISRGQLVGGAALVRYVVDREFTGGEEVDA
jgi:hypothetical protein